MMNKKGTEGSVMTAVVCWGMVVFYFIILGISLLGLSPVRFTANWAMTVVAYFLNLFLLLVIFGAMLGVVKSLPLPFKISVITATVLYTVINSAVMIWVSAFIGVIGYIVMHMSICFVYLLIVLPMLLVGLKNNKSY